MGCFLVPGLAVEGARPHSGLILRFGALSAKVQSYEDGNQQS